MTHVLMDGRQHAAAHTFAARGAQTLAASWIAPTAEALSVYGALLLRGAIAAARHGDRAGATVLLEEAD